MFKTKIFIMCVISIFSYTGFSFTDHSCLKAGFKTEIVKGFGPFGLLNEKLILQKNKCDIFIELKKMKYLSDKWRIDICREPIHIKFGNNFQKVVKKNAPSCEKPIGSYCKTYRELKAILEDNGLIYGKGQREDLSSQHGKVYCSYLLLKQYLLNSVVFSFEKPLEIVLNGPTFINGLENSHRSQQRSAKLNAKNNTATKSEEAETKLYDF